MKIDLSLLCLTRLQRLSRYQSTSPSTSVTQQTGSFPVEKLLEGPGAEQGGAPTKTFYPAGITGGYPSKGRKVITYSQVPPLWS